MPVEAPPATTFVRIIDNRSHSSTQQGTVHKNTSDTLISNEGLGYGGTTSGIQSPADAQDYFMDSRQPNGPVGCVVRKGLMASWKVMQKLRTFVPWRR